MTLSPRLPPMTDNLTDEEMLEIAKAATQGEWKAFDHYCGRDPETAGEYANVRLIGLGQFETLAEVRHGSDDIEGDVDANAKHIATFNPARVIALLGRLKASEELHDERNLFDGEEAMAFADLDAQIEELTARAIAAEAALQWIAKHDNHGLTDGSAATRVCLDAIVQRAKGALTPSQEA